MEQHLLETGQVINTHARTECIGHWCAVHQPMPGPWFWWPRYWREDKGVMERICSCGVGHPVAEMYEWAVVTGQQDKLNHACCRIHPCTPFDGGYQ